MSSLLNRLSGWLFGPPPRIRCSRSIWTDGVDELARRTLDESRESGAYLLGTNEPAGKRILEFVYYDDIDPLALSTGEVTIRQVALPRLWAHCRERGHGVVADVHVHPGGYRQSPSDRSNPVMPRVGHIALILPNFARGQPGPGRIGMYEFLGGKCWTDHSAKGAAFLKIEDR